MRHLRNWNVGKLRVVIAAMTVWLVFSWNTAWADEEAAAAREIMNKWSDAVVTVKVVTKQRMVMKGREMDTSENESEVTATVIDPSGLAVLSFSSIDSSRIYDEILKQAKFGGENTPDFNVESEIKNIKMLLSDGREIPAKLVMKDRDLDLAFVRPTDKSDKPIPYLDISRNMTPGVMDNVVILTRLGNVAGRIPSVSIYRIEAMVRKPRIFYVIDQNAFAGKIGSPVFSIDGKVVGVLLFRIMKSQDKSVGISSMFSGMSSLGMLPVILPIEDIGLVAKQALDTKDGKKQEE